MSDKPPKISVILPVYNGEGYLSSSIESVLNQTFKNIELIIIDDCSTDDSGLIAQRYTEEDTRICYFRNDTNLKLPNSLNKGFSLARGEYWTWTSCDNLYLPNALEEMLNVIKGNQEIGLVYASMQVIDEDSKIIGFIEAGPPTELIYRNVIGACFLYRKSVANAVGSYNPDLFLCEDYEYWLRITHASEIRPIPHCLYQYRKHAKSLSGQYERDIIARGIKVQKQYFSQFISTRRQAALFYSHLRARDIYNPFRQLYLLLVLFYSPGVFWKEVCGLVRRKFRTSFGKV